MGGGGGGRSRRKQCFSRLLMFSHPCLTITILSPWQYHLEQVFTYFFICSSTVVAVDHITYTKSILSELKTSGLKCCWDIFREVLIIHQKFCNLCCDSWVSHHESVALRDNNIVVVCSRGEAIHRVKEQFILKWYVGLNLSI